MTWFWSLALHFFDSMTSYCATKLKEAEEKNKEKRIRNLLYKTETTPEEQRELESLLGKESVIILK